MNHNDHRAVKFAAQVAERIAQVKRQNGVLYWIIDTETGRAFSEPMGYDFAKYVCDVRNGPCARFLARRVEKKAQLKIQLTAGSPKRAG
jgi:hypothetical protein